MTGHTELSGKRVVGPDGKITLPIAGTIAVGGLTREDAAGAITTALSIYYVNLSATVGIDKYVSNRIMLRGHVLNPGVMLFDRTPTLLEVISRSGGLKVTERSDSKVTRDNSPSRCAIFRGKDEVLWVDLKELLDKGSPAADVRLKRNDVVYVPADQDDFVTVIGEVHSPGVVEFDNKTTLPELLGSAGGLTDDAARTIRFIRPSTGMIREVKVNDMLTKSSFDVTFQRGDVIYVPKSGFSKVAHVMAQMNPAGTMLLFAGTLLK